MVLIHKSSHYETVDFKKRHFLIRPIRQAGFSYKDTRNMGFKVSKKLWKTSLIEEPLHLGRLFILKFFE